MSITKLLAKTIALTLLFFPLGCSWSSSPVSTPVNDNSVLTGEKINIRNDKTFIIDTGNGQKSDTEISIKINPGYQFSVKNSEDGAIQQFRINVSTFRFYIVNANNGSLTMPANKVEGPFDITNLSNPALFTALNTGAATTITFKNLNPASAIDCWVAAAAFRAGVIIQSNNITDRKLINNANTQITDGPLLGVFALTNSGGDGGNTGKTNISNRSTTPPNKLSSTNPLTMAINLQDAEAAIIETDITVNDGSAGIPALFGS